MGLLVHQQYTMITTARCFQNNIVFLKANFRLKKDMNQSFYESLSFRINVILELLFFIYLLFFLVKKFLKLLCIFKTFYP